MKTKTVKIANLENFDDLFVGYPADIEKNLKYLLPDAKSLTNKSIYLQILSQIALTQAMQGKFEMAHKTLDETKPMFASTDYVAKTRILLERGRIFHQAHDLNSALPYFKKSYLIAKRHKIDFHTANAAHMIAIIIISGNKNKIKWNKIAINLASKTKDSRAHAWLGPLYNNLAQSYLEDKQYKKAFIAFKKSLKISEKRGDLLIALGVKCALAKTLRFLNSPDEGQRILATLLEELDAYSKKKVIPNEIITQIRGVIYEEFTEFHFDRIKTYSAMAYDYLSKDPWFIKLGSKRLARLKKLSKLDMD